MDFADLTSENLDLDPLVALSCGHAFTVRVSVLPFLALAQLAVSAARLHCALAVSLQASTLDGMLEMGKYYDGSFPSVEASLTSWNQLQTLPGELGGKASCPSCR